MITISAVENKQVKSCGIIGVTVSTPDYAKIAQEAAKRFRKHTGLETAVIDCDGDGFNAKLKMAKMFKDKTVCFFDADLWPVRDYDLSPYEGKGGVYGVVDPCVNAPSTFVFQDMKVLGLRKYLNTGFLIVDFSDPSVQYAFQVASNFTNRKAELGIQDKTEQSLLNYGFKHTEVKELPIEFNFWKLASDWGYLSSIPRLVYNIHAAGYRKEEKAEILKLQAKFFGDGRIRPDTIFQRPYRNSNFKGFIVTTKDQEELAIECKRRVLQYTQIECDIIYANDKDHAHELKITAWENYDGPTLLVDNDLWFVSHHSFPIPNPGEIYATRTAGVNIENRCKEWSIPFRNYFCSGLVLANVTEEFKSVMRNARSLREESSIKTDEVFTNVALARAGFKFRKLDDKLNWCSNMDIVPEVVAIHAARRKEKKEFLMEGVKEYEACCSLQ